MYGIRGVLTMGLYRTFGWPKELRARAPGIHKPVHLRLDTTDQVVYRQVLLQKEYAFDVPFAPRVIVDAGANIGTTAIYFAEKYPQAKIIAVEPAPSNFAMLAKNVKPYPAIVPVHAALWNHGGEINVAPPPPDSDAVGEWGFVTHDGPGIKVRAVTMQELMAEMSVSAIDLAKIDIEGAEVEVFEDTRWLAGLGCLMIECHDIYRPGCSARVDAAMKEKFVRSQRGQTTFYLRSS